MRILDALRRVLGANRCVACSRKIHFRKVSVGAGGMTNADPDTGLKCPHCGATFCLPCALAAEGSGMWNCPKCGRHQTFIDVDLS